MDEYQIELPPSFYAIYCDSRRRLLAPLATVRTRYDLCEDLANHLVEQARTLYHAHTSSEPQVLLSIEAGLRSDGSVVSPAEAQWIVQRLAELLEWPCPLLPTIDASD